MAEIAASRRLIWVPILHTPEDLGELRESARGMHSRRRGRGAWEAYARAAGRFWLEARRRIERLGLARPTTRLYQDALPECGFEEKIVRELAAKGGANYRLLVDLMARGAMLTGTESPRLLAEEYELQRAILTGVPPVDAVERAAALLDARDRFIARRIDETLRAEESGVIFLGMAHSLTGRLPDDVAIERIDIVAAPR